MAGPRPEPWPGPGERLRLAVAAGRADTPALGSVRDLRVRPGAVEGVVVGRGGASFPVTLLADLLGPVWRSRWLEAMADPGEPAPTGPTPGDPRVERAAAGGLDPVPPAGSLRARCTCAAFTRALWCGHAAALAEAVAGRLDAGRWEVLWRLRGLDGGQVLLPVGPAGPVRPDGEERAPGGEGVEDGADDSAFWGTEVGPEPPPVEPWLEAPAALLRLGPLPAARGQADAVEPIVAHYRRVRDAVRAIEAPARAGAVRSTAPPTPVASSRRAPRRRPRPSQEIEG